MFRIHHEGRLTIIIGAVLVLASIVLALWTTHWVFFLISFMSVILLLFLLYFFRNPKRVIADVSLQHIYSPADGRVVVIEEVFEEEFLKEKRIQVSIFMSPLDVHYNTSPVSGTVIYKRHHPGKYLVAWHPKASRENEHCTLVLENNHLQLLLRQIAGAVARRIVNYFNVGNEVEQGQEMGFIKFGSRMDLMLPTYANVHVNIGQHVKANVDIIASIDPVQNDTTE